MVEPKTQREKDSFLKGYAEAELAYGKCHLCYGKGYSIVLQGNKKTVKPCSCPRGKEFAALWRKRKSL